MGLLTDGNADENLQTLKPLISDILDEWGRSVLKDEGIDLEVSALSLSRICLIGEQLFDDLTFPKQPGPFKRAAALCALMRMFGKFSWLPKQGRINLNGFKSAMAKSLSMNAWIVS